MPVRSQEQLKDYLSLIARSIGGLEKIEAQPLEMPPLPAMQLEAAETLADPGTTGRKSADAKLVTAGVQGAQKLARQERLSPLEMAGVEAIIYPDKRPAFDIIDGDFRVTHPIWQKLEDDEDIHARLVAAIPRIGRIELL